MPQEGISRKAGGISVHTPDRVPAMDTTIPLNTEQVSSQQEVHKGMLALGDRWNTLTFTCPVSSQERTVNLDLGMAKHNEEGQNEALRKLDLSHIGECIPGLYPTVLLTDHSTTLHHTWHT